MGKTLRKLIYIILIVLFTTLGIVGLVNRKPSENNQNNNNNNSNSTNNTQTQEIYVICTMSTPFMNETDQTITDYTETHQVIISLKDNQISSKIKNESRIYTDETKYTEYKNSVDNTENLYTFDDASKTVKIKATFDETLLENVNSTAEDIKNSFINLGYTCN